MNDPILNKLLQSPPNLAELKDLIGQSSFFTTSTGYSDRQYSQLIDVILGFKIVEIEKQLLEIYRPYNKTTDPTGKTKQYVGTQAWIGLNPQILQTPYNEILNFLALLQKYSPKILVDLGEGYGRVGLVMKALMPEAEFLGYEIIDSRLVEAERIFKLLGLDNCKMSNANILEEDFEIPVADIYFIYDFSDPHDLKKILNRISKKLYQDKFFIVAKGEGIRSMIQLKYPEFWASHGVIHDEKWSLYSSYCDL